MDFMRLEKGDKVLQSATKDLLIIIFENVKLWTLIIIWTHSSYLGSICPHWLMKKILIQLFTTLNKTWTGSNILPSSVELEKEVEVKICFKNRFKVPK